MSVKALAKRWLTAKSMIADLKAEMEAIEGDLLREVEHVDGGSKTNHADGYKITVKCPINRTIDGERWEEIKDRIPGEYWPIKVKIEPDAKGCDWLATEKPELWAIASEAITERPGKPGFVIVEDE